MGKAKRAALTLAFLGAVTVLLPPLLVVVGVARIAQARRTRRST